MPFESCRGAAECSDASSTPFHGAGLNDIVCMQVGQKTSNIIIRQNELLIAVS